MGNQYYIISCQIKKIKKEPQGNCISSWLYESNMMTWDQLDWTNFKQIWKYQCWNSHFSYLSFNMLSYMKSQYKTLFKIHCEYGRKYEQFNMEMQMKAFYFNLNYDSSFLHNSFSLNQVYVLISNLEAGLWVQHKSDAEILSKILKKWDDFKRCLNSFYTLF